MSNFQTASDKLKKLTSDIESANLQKKLNESKILELETELNTIEEQCKLTFKCTIAELSTKISEAELKYIEEVDALYNEMDKLKQENDI